MDYIESVLDGEIEEKEVARISRYSFALFARLFSILTGYTLGEYLRFRKLSRASGWKFVMENFFPEHGFRHAGSPDFEVYAEGDMDSPAYKMELWIPIVKE